MNSISITGRLGKNPELRFIPSGTAVCELSVANNTGWGDKKKTTWFKVVVWGKHAESVNEYLMKGSHVGVTGEMICDKVDDQYYWKINNARVDFLDPKQANPDVVDEDDIPF